MSDSTVNRASDELRPDALRPDPPGPNSSNDQAFSGYDLETGVLQRMRRWRDAIPVLVLIDALRVAGSPLYVSVFWIAVSIISLMPLTWWMEFPGETLPRLHIDGPADFRGWPFFLAVGWIAIGTLPAGLAARAGGCYAAGRSQSFTENGRVTIVRWLRLFAIVLTPVGITTGLSVVMLAAGTFGRIGSIGHWVVEATAILALPTAILIGLIAAGAIVAVPLAIAAAVLEKQPDVLDSLSRGYEYLYRRPAYLFFCSVFAAILIVIVWQLATLVAGAAISIGGWGLRVGSGQASAPQGYRWLLVRLPIAVALTAAWGQIGAIYLLMRQAANDQEVEDIATSPIDTQSAEMPTLKSEI
ncbi:MAG TPA: hypothetical protein DDZ51_31005 [Planctomycetaceae bacterium]|nr:hypothetical protein [Planctomycetaceae bacterium]